jgi:ADP-heptose:LPS heptosyltransferase
VSICGKSFWSLRKGWILQSRSFCQTNTTMPAARPIIVRLCNWIGDVVLGIPALTALEDMGYAPHCVGKRWAADLLAGHDWPVDVKPAGIRATAALYRRLREQCQSIDPAFDARINAITLATSFSSALEFRLAGLKGLGYATEGRSLLLRKAPAIVHGGHALVRYWDLVQTLSTKPLPAPREIGMRLTEAQRSAAQAALEAAGIGGRFIILCPFAGGTFEKLDKRWPMFATFARELHAWSQARGYTLVTVPGPGEEGLARSDYPMATTLSGVGVGAYAALIERAALTISNDTGPGHIAAALNRPIISVLGPTKPEQWAPWGPSVRVVRGDSEGGIWPGIQTVMSATQQVLA